MASAAARRNRPCGRLVLDTAGVGGHIRAERGSVVVVACRDATASRGAEAGASGAAMGRATGSGMSVPSGALGRSHSRGTQDVVTVTPAKGDRGSPHGAVMATAGARPAVRGVPGPPSTGSAMTLVLDGRSRVTSNRSTARAAPLGSRLRTDSGNVRAPGDQDTGAGGAMAIRMAARAKARNTNGPPGGSNI
jgi:hypothetical protein